MSKYNVLALGAAVAVLNVGSAFAACNVVGTWNEVVAGSSAAPFTMTTNHHGVAKGANQLCPGSKSSTITTTTLNKTTWDFNSTSKNCSEVVSAALKFTAPGTCATTSGETASGTLTIPGYGAFPMTVTKQ